MLPDRNAYRYRRTLVGLKPVLRQIGEIYPEVLQTNPSWVEAHGMGGRIWGGCESYRRTLVGLKRLEAGHVVLQRLLQTNPSWVEATLGQTPIPEGRRLQTNPSWVEAVTVFGPVDDQGVTDEP